MGPVQFPQKDELSWVRTPSDYIQIFRNTNFGRKVRHIVRLNRHDYDEQDFLRSSFRHTDLYFPDGTSPTDVII